MHVLMALIDYLIADILRNSGYGRLILVLETNCIR